MSNNENTNESAQGGPMVSRMPPMELRCVTCGMRWPDEWNVPIEGYDLMHKASPCPGNPTAIPFVTAGAAGHTFDYFDAPCVGACR